MSTEGFPTGPDSDYAVSADWNGKPETAESATWTAVDGIGDAVVAEGSPAVAHLRSPAITTDGPVTTIITLTGWDRPADGGQWVLKYARRTRTDIGFRWRPDGTDASAEYYMVKVGPRDHRASAEGGLQPVTFTLIAQTHVVTP